jgi:hypothetical protein
MTPKISPSAEAQNAVAAVSEAAKTITITFNEKYKALYDELAQAAEMDERSLAQYVLRFLRDNHAVSTADSAQ